MVKIVSSIFQSNIYRPGRFHKLCINTLLRLKSTSEKNEIASRSQNQKLIDHAFGPPAFYEPDANESNAKLQDKDTILDVIKQLGKYAKSHGLINPNISQKSEHKGIEEETNKINIEEKQDIVISHDEKVERTSKKSQESKLENKDKCSAPDISDPSPCYDRKTEAQMFDDLAIKYLKEELDQIDKELARDMEHLEIPGFRPKEGAMVSSTLVNISNNADNKHLSNYSNYFEPSINYMDIIASKDPNALKIYDDRNDTLPPHVIGATDKANVYQVNSFYEYHEIPHNSINCFNQFDSTQNTSNNDSHIAKLELDETLSRHTYNLDSVKVDQFAGVTSVSRVMAESMQPNKELDTIVQTKPKVNHGEFKLMKFKKSSVKNLTRQTNAMKDEKLHLDENVKPHSWNDVKQNIMFRNVKETVVKQNHTEPKGIEFFRTFKIQAQISPKSDEEQPKATPPAVLTQAQKILPLPEPKRNRSIYYLPEKNTTKRNDISLSTIGKDTGVQQSISAQTLPKSKEKLSKAMLEAARVDTKENAMKLSNAEKFADIGQNLQNDEIVKRVDDIKTQRNDISLTIIEKDTGVQQSIPVQTLPESKENLSKAMLEAARLDTKENAMTVSNAEKSADIGQNLQNDEIVKRVDDIKTQRNDISLTTIEKDTGVQQSIPVQTLPESKEKLSKAMFEAARVDTKENAMKLSNAEKSADIGQILQNDEIVKRVDDIETQRNDISLTIIEKDTGIQQSIPVQTLPESKENLSKAMLEAARVDTKENAMKVSNAEKSADIGQNLQNDETVKRVDDIKTQRNDISLMTIEKDTGVQQSIPVQTLPESKEKLSEAMLKAARVDTKENAMKVSNAEKSTDIGRNLQNDEIVKKVADIKNLELNPDLPLEELLRRIRARNRIQDYKKIRPINISSLITARKPSSAPPKDSNIYPLEFENPYSPECPPPSLSVERCPPTDRPQCPSPPDSFKGCPPDKPKCPPPDLGGKPKCPSPPCKNLKFTLKTPECQPPCCPHPPISLPCQPPPPPSCPQPPIKLPCQPPAPSLPPPCIVPPSQPPSPPSFAPPPICPSRCCPSPCGPPPGCPSPCGSPPGCPSPCCPSPCCPPRCKFHTAAHTFWHRATMPPAVYLSDDCPPPCLPPGRRKPSPPKCSPEAKWCPSERPKKCPKVEPCDMSVKCPPDPPECPKDPCPPNAPPKPKCPPPPKPKCAIEPKCPPIRKCPPEPKCAPKPICPPKPKCPSVPKCPPKPKCITGSSLHDSIIIVSSALSTSTIACNRSNSFKEIIENRLLQLIATSCMAFMESILEMTTLYLNRVKDFVPWTPIPSWPYPIKEEKPKLQCPQEGCPFHQPERFRPPCPYKPCPGFPKRLSFSQI